MALSPQLLDLTLYGALIAVMMGCAHLILRPLTLTGRLAGGVALSVGMLQLAFYSALNADTLSDALRWLRFGGLIFPTAALALHFIWRWSSTRLHVPFIWLAYTSALALWALHTLSPLLIPARLSGGWVLHWTEAWPGAVAMIWLLIVAVLGALRVIWRFVHGPRDLDSAFILAGVLLGAALIIGGDLLPALLSGEPPWLTPIALDLAVLLLLLGTPSTPPGPSAHGDPRVAGSRLADAQPSFQQSTPLPGTYDVLDAFSEGMLITDRDGRLLYVNPALCHLTGRSSGDLLGLRFTSLFSFEDAHQIDRQSSDSELFRRYSLKAASGDVIEVQIARSPLLGGEGTVFRVQPLSDERRNLMAMLGRIPVGVVITANNQIQYANRAFSTLCARRRSDLVGEDPMSLIYPPDQRTFQEEGREDTINDVRHYQLRVQRGGGETRWADVMISDLFLSGALIRMLTFVDINNIKSTERALTRATNRLLALIENTDDAIWSVDSQLQVITFNTAAQRLFRQAFDITLGASVDLMPLFPPDQRGIWETHCRRALDGERFSVQYSADLDGARAHFHCAFNPIHGASEKIEGVTIFVRDETARLEADERLMQSEAWSSRLAMVASLTINGVIITAANGRIEWVNEGFTRITGYTLDMAQGGSPLDYLAQGDGHPSAKAMRAAIEDRASFNLQVHGRRVDGSPCYLRVEGQPLSDAWGTWVGFMFLITDITEDRIQEEALRRARDEAEQATQAKSMFLATMSHELRTPMNGVIGIASLLEETLQRPEGLGAEQRDYVRIIRRSGETLLSLLNDILDLSKIEAQAIELETHPFNIETCVSDALDLMAPQARAQGIELAVFIDARVPARVLGDVTRLRQVLVNLLSNAVKFTERGSVTLRISPDASAGGVRFSVRDTGIGIPADRVNRLFQPFSQVDASTSRRFGGTGLGLAISQRLCALMGGGLSVQSEEGAGSVFQFTARLPAVSHPTEHAVELTADYTVPPQLKGRRILVLHPEPFTRQVLIDQLTSWGMEGQGPDSQMPSPALVILTEGQPCPSAYERLPHIRIADPRPGPRQASQLVRPIKPQPLLKAIVSALLNTQPALTPIPAPTPLSAQLSPLPADLSVLLVEDNAVNQKVAQRYLDRWGISADLAADGVEALEALSLRRYDLILMDVQMPRMDGFEATRRIRALADAHQPYIIAMTANAMDSDRQRCLAAGMNDYLSKPVRLRHLHAAMVKGLQAGSDHPVEPS